MKHFNRPEIDIIYVGEEVIVTSTCDEYVHCPEIFSCFNCYCGFVICGGTYQDEYGTYTQ